MAEPQQLTENKEVVRRYYEEVLNEGNLHLLEDLVSADVVNHDAISDEELTPAEARGFEGFRSHAKLGIDLGMQITLEETIAEDDKVLVRFVTEFTHDTRFAGIEPTGNEVAVSAMVLYRLEDGKIVERWMESDGVEMLRQLGVSEIPQP